MRFPTLGFSRFGMYLVFGPMAWLVLPLSLHAACGPYNISAVPDKPFTAEITLTEWEVKPDGSNVQIHAEATSAVQIHFARDNSGRIAVWMIPQEGSAAPHKWTTWVCDAGAGTTTIYRAASPSAPGGAELDWTGEVQATSTTLVDAPLSCRTFSPAAQSLGQRAIQGLAVHGCRATVVANGQPVPGQFLERWWSKDLQSDLEGAQINQAAGTKQQWVVSALEQTDPDPSVFQRPANVTMLPPVPAGGGN